MASDPDAAEWTPHRCTKDQTIGNKRLPSATDPGAWHNTVSTVRGDKIWETLIPHGLIRIDFTLRQSKTDSLYLALVVSFGLFLQYARRNLGVEGIIEAMVDNKAC